jgi:phosphoribosyl-ATP pyrophosphohydrolase
MEDFFEDLKNRPRPNIFERIYLWWDMDGRYYHKYFKQGVKNLWYWFPVIWKDRNWDSHYIFDMLQHKLTAQANYIGRRDFHTRAQLDAKRMRLCVKLIKKVQEEDYTMEYMDYHKDRVWFTDCEDRPGSSLYNSEEVWEKYDEYFAKYPLVYKRVLKGEGVFTLNGRDESDMKRVIAMNIAHLNHDRARKLLFKIMEENIESWWD